MKKTQIPAQADIDPIITRWKNRATQGKNTPADDEGVLFDLRQACGLIEQADAPETAQDTLYRVIDLLEQGDFPGLLQAITPARLDLPDCIDWTEPQPLTDFLIPGWLPAGRVSMLSGNGGVGKSKLALQLSMAVAGKQFPEWLTGAPPVAEHGRVIYCSWEDSPGDVRFRMCDHPALKNHPDTRQKFPAMLGQRLQFVDCSAHGGLWNPGGTGHTSNLGVLSNLGKEIRKRAETAKLLIIDPLAAAYCCNENDRGLVRQFMASWDGWARATGCAVLLIAHPPKGGAPGNRGALFSGSTDWHNAARAVISLGIEKLPDSEKKATRLECIKSSYGHRPEPLRLSNWKWWQAEPWPEDEPEPEPAKPRAKNGRTRPPPPTESDQFDGSNPYA